MSKKGTKTLFPDKSAGHYPALILLWAGAFVIFLIMITLWYKEDEAEKGMFVDELLLSANDLSISGRKELINTLLTSNNEYDTVSTNTFAGRDKLYKKLYEQQVKNTSQSRSGGGGIDIRPVP